MLGRNVITRFDRLRQDCNELNHEKNSKGKVENEKFENRGWKSRVDV